MNLNYLENQKHKKEITLFFSQDGESMLFTI